MNLFKIAVFFGFVFFVSCNSKKNIKFENLEFYDLSKPTLINLPLELDEISGLSFYEKDLSLFAISDDRGAIFKITPNVKIDKWKFSHGADFEDLARVDSSFYILQSNGDIFKTKFYGNKSDVKVFNFPYNKNNEFETLYNNLSSRKLVLICKDCEADKKKSLTTYTFDLDTETYSDSSFIIDIASVDSILNLKSTRFKPSAASINPVDGKLYIISSVNKMLLIADSVGNVSNAYKISPSLFKQPEGIAFTKKGDMIISNEFAGTGTAELLIFKRKTK